MSKMTLYHGVKNESAVDSIIEHGFDLAKIRPIWTNDYAISTMTTKAGVLKFFGRNVPVLKLEIEGVIVSYFKVNVPHAKDAQDYTRQIVAAGIDAVILDSDSRIRQVFIYNTKSIKSISRC